jgi:4-hydroxy-3-methylbut-2-enyl diphosphate reductase
LAKYLTGEKTVQEFYLEFKGQFSENFDVQKDLQRIGVVNQTTMLASDTQAIADFLRLTMMQWYGLDEKTIAERFADTRDTLCYATNDNQTAVSGMLTVPADLAIVVGGYNSSNTSHLVELCEEKLPTFYINSDDKILSAQEIMHYDFHHSRELLTRDYLPGHSPIKILITSGASCPDALVEAVIRRLAGFLNVEEKMEELTLSFS